MNSRSHLHARIPYFEQHRYYQNSVLRMRGNCRRNQNGNNCYHRPQENDAFQDDAGADFLFIDQDASLAIKNIGDNVDISLTAPLLSQWYHGKLDRVAAEKRLLMSSKTGSYLVRQSDRKSNWYVLSYLGHQGINHFRIASLCGEFFIGGRKFDSLSHLIGFYTTVSDLLKNERLLHPVPPPTPVKDHKRVIAIHPYVKVPDTDELSFLKGDIFTVQNDLSIYADGWLWCVNLRTFESGLVFQDLVVELDEDLDVNELFPWYHSNISKEEAVDKLAKMGPGSFLVRRSERSPGNYSLFFHINNTVQRFRIERLGNRYIMGGRTFDSLDAVIKRYQHEQIVEGHCLGDPVLKAPIQVSLPQMMRNTNLNNNRQPHQPSFGAHSSQSNDNKGANNFFINSEGILQFPNQCNQQTVESVQQQSSQQQQGNVPVSSSVTSTSTTIASSDNSNDIYATLRESRELAKKKQSVWMKGYLFKKSKSIFLTNLSSSSFILSLIIFSVVSFIHLSLLASCFHSLIDPFCLTTKRLP